MNDEMQAIMDEMRTMRDVIALMLKYENMRCKNDLLRRLYREDDPTKIARLLCDAEK